jgi:hypothetical protein
VRIRALLETQKRLYADLERAKEQQQRQRNSQRQQPSAQIRDSQAAASSSSGEAGSSGTPSTPAAAANSSSGSEVGTSSSSSSDSHDAYIDRLGQLLESSTPKVSHLQQQLEDVIREFRWLAEYYCEDVKGQAWKQQPVSFLTHFLELLDNISATMKDTGRLARVTAMLAEYMEARNERHLKKLEQQQVAASEAQAVQQDAQAGELVADAAEELEARQALLQHQQQLLRQHAASELLRRSASKCAGSSSSSSISGDGEEDQEYQPSMLDQQQRSSSGRSSARSSAEGAQMLVDELMQLPRQQKPACVPRLQLGGGQPAASAAAAGASSSRAVAGVMPEQSWGSDIGGGLPAGSVVADAGDGAPLVADGLQAADAAGLQQQRYGSPLRQPVFDEQHAAEAAEGAQQELGASAAGARGSLAASWSPVRSVGLHSSGDTAHGLATSLIIEDSTGEEDWGELCSALQGSNPLAVAAAGVARQRRAAQTAMSRSLDSSMFAAAYASSSAASAARPDSSGGSSSSSKPPSGGQARSQSQQKSGMRQPWRPAGQGQAASPGGRKWTQQDAQLAQEVAAAAAAAAAGRPKCVSPVSVGGNKPSVQQQRLDALRLRSKPRTPEPGKQQRQGARLGGCAGSSPDSSSAGVGVAGDQHDRLALLLSSIDSEM